MGNSDAIDIKAGREAILNRLRRIEGQVKGLQRMVEEERPCEDIITQIAALKSAVNKVGVNLIAPYVLQCLKDDLSDGKEVGPTLERFTKILALLS